MNAAPENAKPAEVRPPYDSTIADWSALANVVLIVACLAWGFMSLLMLVWIWVLPLLAAVIIASLMQAARHRGTWASLKGPGFGLLVVAVSVPIGLWHADVIMDAVYSG